MQPRWCGLLDLLVADLVLRAQQREPHLHGEGHRHGGQRRVDAAEPDVDVAVQPDTTPPGHDDHDPADATPRRTRARRSPSARASRTRRSPAISTARGTARARLPRRTRSRAARTRSVSGRPTRSRRPTPIPRRRPSPGKSTCRRPIRRRPITTITSGPSGHGHLGQRDVHFASNEPDSVVRVQPRRRRRSSAAPRRRATRRLANGSHTFSCRRRMPARNTDTTGATRTWTVALPVGGTVSFPSVEDAYVNSSSPVEQLRHGRARPHGHEPARAVVLQVQRQRHIGCGDLGQAPRLRERRDGERPAGVRDDQRLDGDRAHVDEQAGDRRLGERRQGRGDPRDLRRLQRHPPDLEQRHLQLHHRRAVERRALGGIARGERPVPASAVDHHVRRWRRRHDAAGHLDHRRPERHGHDVERNLLVHVERGRLGVRLQPGRRRLRVLQFARDLQQSHEREPHLHRCAPRTGPATPTRPRRRGRGPSPCLAAPRSTPRLRRSSDRRRRARC